jgi:hypothetical protein
MPMSRTGLSSLMGYQEGGDPSSPTTGTPTGLGGFDFDASVKKYEDRLLPYVSQQPPVSGYDVASMLGRGLLAQQAEKFPSLGRGLGMGFQDLSAEIKKRQEEKRKEKQAVAMKAMEMASQDEQSAQKFLNDYSLKLIDLANKEIKTTKFDTSMLVDAKDENGNPIINPQTGVGYKSETTVKANDNKIINDLLQLGANEIDSATTRINLGQESKADEERAKRIIKNESKWQDEADAADALRDQILIARSLAEKVGEENFGPVDSLTMGLRGIMLDLGMGNLVDEDVLASQQALTQTSIGFVMALVGKTKGAISNKEMEIFFQASPTLGSTYKGYMMMLDYMDRIAELSVKYNEGWTQKLLDLGDDPTTKEEANAMAKFKTEFKSKPENKLIQTEEEREYLKSIADKSTYDQVNNNYLEIQKEANKNSEQDSIAKLKSDIIAEMALAETTTERKVYLQSLLDQLLDQMEE